MADMIANPRKARRLARVDLTPMVDLGFLLITFFVFTTELSQRKTMSLYLPKPSGDSMQVAASGAVTLLLGDGITGLYTGDQPAAMIRLDIRDPQALRRSLLDIRGQLISRWGTDDKLFVSIKPTSRSHFGDVIHALDEMTICQVKRYALTDAMQQEEDLLAEREN